MSSYTATKENRAISEEFAGAFLKEQPLHSFLSFVKNPDNNLILCFRADAKAQVVTIYYRNKVMWRIKKLKKSIKVEISPNHEKDHKKRFELLKKLRDDYGFMISKDDEKILLDINKGLPRYPYCERTAFDSKFVLGTYKLMIKAFNSYFKNEKTQKENYIEKGRQQQLFNYFDNNFDGIYAYDLEFNQKHENTQKRKEDGEQNHPDLLAIRYNQGKPKSIVLIEVKSTEKACKDEGSDILSHAVGMKEYLDSEHLKFRIKEAHDIIKLYKTMGLHNAPELLPDPNCELDKESALILTDEAITYYTNHKQEIDDQLSNNETNCPIFKWTQEDGLSLFDK